MFALTDRLATRIKYVMAIVQLNVIQKRSTLALHPQIEGCPQAPTCEPNQVDNNGKYCDVQKCTLTCDDEYEFCAGKEMGDGCFEEDA